MKLNFFLKNMLFIVVILTTISSSSAPGNFNKSKKIAAKIFDENSITLYCGCRYSKKQIDLTSCGMEPAANIERAHRLEWEHMMPAENFGRQLACWNEKLCERKNGVEYKGRKCCEKQSFSFNEMESELYNLWPAVGLINAARSNYRYTQFSVADFQKASFYGCHILIDNLLRKVEPRDEAKGIVARANLFMSKKYNIQLSSSQRQLFEAWNKQYPPSAWELSWAAQVATIEGYQNSFIIANTAR